jgi:hypothetical protein
VTTKKESRVLKAKDRGTLKSACPICGWRVGVDRDGKIFHHSGPSGVVSCPGGGKKL